MNFQKIFKIVLGVISVAGAALLGMIWSKGDEFFESAYALGEDTALIDNMSYVAYIVLFLIILFVVFFVLKNLVTNASSLKSTLIGVGAFLAVLVIAYMLSSGDTTEYLYNDVAATEKTSHFVGAGLVAFYILGIVAILSMLFSGVKKLIK